MAPSLISRIKKRWKRIKIPSIFPLIRSLNGTHVRRQHGSEDEERRRRLLWRGGLVICSIVIVGGVMYAFGVSWSNLEAPFILDSQLSSRSLVTDTMSVILPSYIVSYAANPLSNLFDSFLRLPPYPHSFHRMVMSWLRFLWSHFLALSPQKKIVALYVVHSLSVATVNHIFCLGWGATRYLLRLLHRFLAAVIRYFRPPPPPPAQSGLTIYANVSFHGEVTFLSSVHIRRNSIYAIPRSEENEPNSGAAGQ